MNLHATSPLNECNPNDKRILGSDDFAGRLLKEAWRPKSRKTIADLGDAGANRGRKGKAGPAQPQDGLSGSKAARQLDVVRAFNFKDQCGVHFAIKSDYCDHAASSCHDLVLIVRCRSLTQDRLKLSHGSSLR